MDNTKKVEVRTDIYLNDQLIIDLTRKKELKTKEEILKEVLESDFAKRIIGDFEWDTMPLKEHILKAMQEYADRYIPKWISIDEEPDKGGYYLTYYSNDMDRGIDIRYFRKEEGGHWNGWQYSDVKFWMPLPNPPQN